MATVVNVEGLGERFRTLGWSTLSLTEVVEAAAANGVASAALVAYLDALIAAPASLDDQAIPGCAAATATKVTGYLKSKGVVAV